MVQFEMYFTNEYIEEIVCELANKMELNVSRQDILVAMQEKDKNSPKNVFVLKENNSMICVDCNDKDWIFPLVVKCKEEYADAVNAVMLKWDNLIRQEYGQELTMIIPNVYGKKNTLLNSIEEYYRKVI